MLSVDVYVKCAIIKNNTSVAVVEVPDLTPQEESAFMSLVERYQSRVNIHINSTVTRPGHLSSSGRKFYMFSAISEANNSTAVVLPDSEFSLMETLESLLEVAGLGDEIYINSAIANGNNSVAIVASINCISMATLALISRSIEHISSINSTDSDTTPNSPGMRM